MGRKIQGEKGVKITNVTYEVNNIFDLTYKHPNTKILTRCRAYFDREKEILHILDKDFPGDRSVTNSLSTEFLEWVLDEMMIRFIPEAVYCYGPDGRVVEFGFKTDFKFRPVKKEKLKTAGFDKFLDGMQKR